MNLLKYFNLRNTVLSMTPTPPHFHFEMCITFTTIFLTPNPKNNDLLKSILMFSRMYLLIFRHESKKIVIFLCKFKIVLIIYFKNVVLILINIYEWSLVFSVSLKNIICVANETLKKPQNKPKKKATTTTTT